MFDTTKEDLKDLLRYAHEGRLQLPDFQRDYVWGDDDVRSLIASVAKGFPVGALLTLQTGGEVRFKPRLLAGIPARDESPDELLLDGQQRITSLYQSTYSEQPVRTRSPRGMEIERYYYLDIRRALSIGADIEEAIIGVPADRKIRTNFGRNIELDLSEQHREFALNMFPLNKVFDSRSWFYAWRDYWRERGEDVSDLERDFDQGVVDRIARYKMPLIRLDRNNSREGICLVFEKVNVGGKKLDAFELLTAIFAASDFDLRHDWHGSEDKSQIGRRGRIIGSPNPRDVLTQVASIDFLQACTLLHTRERRLARAAEGTEGRDLPQISCKRDALLSLPLDGYRAHSDAVEAGIIEAGTFLNEHKIIWHKDIPYPPLVVGLASTFAILGKEARTTVAKEKIAHWFWSVTLGELFGSSTESRLARDVPELVDWIRNEGPKPRALDEAVFQQERLRSLRIRISAAYKGIHALLMSCGCKDFKTNRATDIMTFFNDQIDIHHIFPKRGCKTQGIPSTVYNSIVNKTPLSRASNISIGGDAPSVYLRRIEEQEGVSSDILDEILRSHLINPEHLRADDFESFFKERMQALSVIIAKAMDKPVVMETGTNESERDIELEEQEIVDLESAA